MSLHHIVSPSLRQTLVAQAETKGWMAATRQPQHLKAVGFDLDQWVGTDCEAALSRAFPVKRAVHAGMSGVPVPEADTQALLDKLHTQPRTGTCAAYVHLPYCESKCLYCGFFGGKYSEEKGEAYLHALLGEIEAEESYASTGTKTGTAPIHALYLGGGTPTALSAKALLRLLKTLRRHLPLANDCEITVEGRIHNFGADKIEACLEGGANRFSLGVQTFNTTQRRALGRFADKEAVIKHLQMLAAYNQAAIVIDLIYGLPGQSVSQWKDDIRTFLALPIDGVDLYQLNVFPNSALAKTIAAGKLSPTAPLHEQGSYFMAGHSLMQEARMKRLSMSHWGRNTRERNLYNPLAKTRADCLHFGAGAGGALQGYFMANESSPDAYMAARAQGKKPISMVMAPPRELAAMRSILQQMEECRLNTDVLGAALAPCLATTPIPAGTPASPSHDPVSAAPLFAPLLDNWEEAGLITRDGPWVELTLAGQFWQVNLTQALLGWQRSLVEAMYNDKM